MPNICQICHADITAIDKLYSFCADILIIDTSIKSKNRYNLPEQTCQDWPAALCTTQSRSLSIEPEESLLITSCKVMHIFGQTTLKKE